MVVYSGLLHAVYSRRLGSETVGDHAAGATTLVLASTADFVETGGGLVVEFDDGTEQAIAYLSADPDAETVELAEPLTLAAEDGCRVRVDPLKEQTVGMVLLDVTDDYPVDETGAVEVQIPPPYVPLLAEGNRAIGEEEHVDVELVSDGVLRLAYLHDEPVRIQPSALPPLPGVEQVAYYSPEPPVLTADDAGKVWYDTDSGMAVSRWDGTQWVAAPIGSFAMAETLVGKMLIGGEIHAPKIYMGDTGARMVLVNSEPEGVSGASQRILGFTGYEAEMPAEIYFRGYVDELSRTVGQTFVGSPRFDSSGFARLLLESREDGTSKATLGADVVSVDSPWGFSSLRADKVVTSRVQTPSGMAIISESRTLTGGSPGSYLSGLTVVEGDMVASTGVITVPEDLSIDEQHRVRIEANVCLASTATRAYIEILDASNAIIPGGRVEAGNATATYKTLDIGRTIPCWAGDTFRVRVYCAATTTMQGATIPVLLQAWME